MRVATRPRNERYAVSPPFERRSHGYHRSVKRRENEKSPLESGLFGGIRRLRQAFARSSESAPGPKAASTRRPPAMEMFFMNMMLCI